MFRRCVEHKILYIFAPGRNQVTLLLRLNIMNSYFGEKHSDRAELMSKFKSYQSNSSAVLTETLFPDLKAWFTSNSHVNLGHKEVLIQMKCQSIAFH